MSSELNRHPASILFIGIVFGLVTAPHLRSLEQAVFAALTCAVLSLAVHSGSRLLTCLLFLSVATGIAAAEFAARGDARSRELVRSLSPGRFVTIMAPIDDEWRPGRNGAFSNVSRFEVLTEDGVVAIDERLSIYAPADVAPIGENDFIRADGFLRESRSGSLYVSTKSRRLVSLSSTRTPWHPRYWNRWMRSALERHVAVFPEHERAASLIRAVALGDGSALSSEMRDSYRRGGTYHLLVFSGMQIAFAAALIALLLRSLRMHFATDLSLVALAMIAPAFAGNEPSVGRAATMIGVYGVSRLLGRPTRMANLLFLSAAIRLVMRPEELSSPGFLLTYAATFGLVVVGRALAETVDHPFAKTVAYGIGAELCTQPLTLFFFRHFVVGGFAVTMILSPLLGFVLLLSIPLAATLAAESDITWLLVELVARIDHVAIAINEVWSGMRLSGFAPAPPAVLVIATFTAAWIASLSIVRAIPRATAVAAILLVVPGSVWVLHVVAREGGPAIEFLDVGQGDATLLRGTRTLLVDGGGSPNDPEFGRRALVPLLADRGIRSVDVVVMSHPDADHCGGLVSLVRTIAVGEVWISPRHIGAPCTTELLAGIDGYTRLRFVRDGEVIRTGDIETQVTLARLRFKKSPLNNGSIVLTASLGGVRAILAGDIEREAEAMISDEAGNRLRGEIFKVPHHGSRTSTTTELLRTVRPDVAVISSGIDNLYGHPSPEVLTRLRHSGAHVLRTDQSGSIRIRICNGGMSLELADHAIVNLTENDTCS